MIHQVPTFTCDACQRPLGLNFKPLEDIMERETMSQFPLHFCNNNCKHSYQKDHTLGDTIYWLSMDWPKITASLR